VFPLRCIPPTPIPAVLTWDLPPRSLPSIQTAHATPTPFLLQRRPLLTGVDPARRRRSSSLPSFQLVAVDPLPRPLPSIQLVAAWHCAERESKTWFSHIKISDYTPPSIWASSTCGWVSSLDPSLPRLGQAHPLLQLFDGLSPSC
jgi:hypothetical protein